jgi:PAS domain-containing protein
MIFRKRTVLVIFLLLPVSFTILFGLLQRGQYRGNHVWLYLGFNCIATIVSVFITLIIIHELTGRNTNEAGLVSDNHHTAEEKLADVIINNTKEKMLQESEVSKQIILDSIKDYAIFMIDLNGKVASWNKGAEHIKGYRPEEIIGHPIEIFYTNEDIANNVPRHNLQMA